MLVPDELTNRIVSDRLSKEDAKNGVLLDGYPRNKEQCEELDKILSSLGRILDVAINLDVPYEELLRRITNRRVCIKCKEGYNIEYYPPRENGICDKCGGDVVQRDDDKPEIVEARLKIYYEQAQEILDYYESQGKLHTEVAGDKVGRTSKDVVNTLVEYFNNK